MWNSLVVGLSLASVLSGVGRTLPLEASAAEHLAAGPSDMDLATAAGPARLHIREITPTRAIGIHVSALDVDAVGWGTVGASYGISIGDYAAVEGTVDVGLSAGRLGGLGSVRFLGRRPTREGECYAILGVAFRNGIATRGLAPLLGAGARFTLTEEIALATELQLLLFEQGAAAVPLGTRAVVGIVLRRE